MNAEIRNDPGHRRPSASLVVDDVIARYRSVEQKRIALRRALSSRPDDARLLQMREQLTRPPLIRKAAAAGVFISYIRSDELFAVELAEALAEINIDAWLDMFDVENGTDWHSAVSSALQRCGLMLAVMSPESIYDNLVTLERQQFQEAGKLVMPVLYRPCHLGEIGFWLEPVDFTRNFTLGLNNLQRRLQAEAGV